ncbi:hypothetical protein DQR70_06070 [Salmonella enterica subsp. enterica serovar Oslo]|nr:hypothetical protein [Salmonella enterica subsp. enterica serovar Oslo]ELF5187081.1 hypothetical protein [Salmonella enterica]
MSTIKTNIHGVRYATVLTAETAQKNVPIWDPEGLHKEWGLWEIYMGPDHIGEGRKGRFVGNVLDKVWDPVKGTQYIKELNPTTLIPEFARVEEPSQGGADSKDFLLGIGDRWPQQGFFIYVDNEQEIPRISVDSQAIFRHPNVEYFRLYGYSETAGEEILSAWYNQTGEYVDNQIPRLNVEAVDSPYGYKYYVPESFWGTRQLIPGEEVKLVGFSKSNSQVTEASFVVRDGNFIRRGNTPTRRIVSVELRSPYLSTTEENRLRIPTGTNVASIAMMARITMDSGRYVDLPIDGQKVRVQGLEETVTSSPGYLRDLILYYYLGEGEVYIGSDNNDGKALKKRYTVEVDPTQETYGFKLFVYPSWIDANTGYGLVAFLHDYDHSQVYDVSNMIELSSNSAEWDPKKFGVKQYLRFAIDVDKVDPRYGQYRHTQVMQFTLIEPALVDASTHWRAYFEDGQNPGYGDNLVANLEFVSSQDWTGDLSCGAKSLDEWLDRLYYRTLPLFDPQTETKPMVPTHFVFTVRGQRYRHPISDWNSVIRVKTGGVEGESSVIHFISSQNGVDLQLGSSALFIHQIIA